MSRTCQFAFAGRTGPAEWAFDESYVTVRPAEGRPLVFPVQEIAGISGDGYTVELAVPGAPGAGPPAGRPEANQTPGPGGAAAPALLPRRTLAKLGAEGPTLLDALQRSWLEARAKALRLGGTGEGKPFSGMVTGLDGEAAGGEPGAGDRPAAGRGPQAGSAEPFKALLFEDVMAIAREGRDLDPLFLALTEQMSFDDASYTVQVAEWPGRRLVFSRLAKRTEEFFDQLKKSRNILTSEATKTLSSAVPSLPAAYRGLLAGDWPPGRLRTLDEMNAICPGFTTAFRDVWLAASVRKEEGAFLLDWATAGGCWLGCSREAGEAGEALLWMLAGKGGAWFLEALTGEDRATYRFSAGAEMPALVSRLLCAPQFSKEALYGTPDMLTGERADLAIAAQFLGFLAALRARFRGRVIHTAFDSWRTEVAATAGQA